MGHTLGILQALDSLADGGLYVDFLEFLYEKVAILGNHDCLDRCAEHFHSVLVKHSAQVQFGAAVECSLPSECEQNAVGTLFFDYFLYKIGRNRQEIYLVGYALGGLDCCNVGIDEHTGNALFSQRLQSLRPGVVKFARLPDFQGA